MKKIFVNEVGPRDGLQNIDIILNIDERFQLIQSLERAGINSLEVGSFVSPKAVPAMDKTDALLEKLSTGNSNYSVLIPNTHGYKQAKENKVKEVCLVLCATESMNMENINKNIKDTITEFKEIIKMAKKDQIRTKIYISVAFECPYEGPVNSQYVYDLTKEFVSYGINEVVIADTIGAGNPNQVQKVFRELVKDFGSSVFSAHFHDTRLLALSNVKAAMEEGITKFDSCIAGLGGCPFAPGASGNLATEDLVSMLHKEGYETGINEKMLRNSAQLAAQLTN
jgi:hydroxymethylglutaryl-CoA lyase|tara:strand:+ start:159 stop:1004 length:846 start_codon:yes stop_codon:yes gene_type:complete